MTSLHLVSSQCPLGHSGNRLSRCVVSVFVSENLELDVSSPLLPKYPSRKWPASPYQA